MRGPGSGALVALLALSMLGIGCASDRSFSDRYHGYRERTREGLDRTRRGLEWGLEHGPLVRVKPWERGVLSRADMAWQPDPLHAARRSHIYFSKEASLIGGSAGGGGCGCN